MCCSSEMHHTVESVTKFLSSSFCFQHKAALFGGMFKKSSKAAEPTVKSQVICYKIFIFGFSLFLKALNDNLCFTRDRLAMLIYFQLASTRGFKICCIYGYHLSYFVMIQPQAFMYFSQIFLFLKHHGRGKKDCLETLCPA